MSIINQLVLTVDGSEVKIQLNASNDAGLSLIPSMIREADCASPLSASSAPFEPHAEAANDPGYYQDDIDFGRLRSSAPAPNGKWIDTKIKLNGSGRIVLGRLLGEMEAWKAAERFHADKYLLALDLVLANLVWTHSNSQQLLISFKTAHKSMICGRRYVTNVTLAECVRFLESAGYLQIVDGAANQFDGRSSWCAARSKLVALFDQTGAAVALADGFPFAVIRERPIKEYGADGVLKKESGSVIQLPASSRENARLKQAEEPLIRYTETWCNHTATLDGKYVAPWLTRIFILNTSLGGRFYGDFQNLPKVDRDRILIDGEPTVELDFKSLHYAMMYALAGIQLEEDPYTVDGYSRKAIKQVSLILANTSCLRALKSHITLSGNSEYQKVYSEVKHNLAVYKEPRARGLKCDKPYVPPWYDTFIEGLPVGVEGEQLISALKKRHPAIANRFGEPDIGLKLQNKDSQIMAHALTLLSDTPVLPVHDSIRCRMSDAERVREAMLEAGRVVLGVTLVVTND